MKVLIVEDEPLAAERLKLVLGAYDPSIEVMEVLDSIQGTKNWLSRKPLPDLIFLDIELADGRCFQLLPYLRQECPVIFTTAYDNFALDAFQHFSIDYLLKPVTAESLARALNRYHSMTRPHKWKTDSNISLQLPVNKPYKNRFIVKSGSRMSFLETNDIAYFFAEGKVVFLVHRDGQKYPVDYTLEKLEEILDPLKFFRFNRKIIGNVNAIRDIRTYMNSRLRICLSAGNHNDEAIVSRERVQAFRQWADA
jgi:two-component system, LytTR family, response regulator LytT